jgi:hypothetical protein
MRGRLNRKPDEGEASSSERKKPQGRRFDPWGLCVGNVVGNSQCIDISIPKQTRLTQEGNSNNRYLRVVLVTSHSAIARLAAR